MVAIGAARTVDDAEIGRTMSSEDIATFSVRPGAAAETRKAARPRQGRFSANALGCFRR